MPNMSIGELSSGYSHLRIAYFYPIIFRVRIVLEVKQMLSAQMAFTPHKSVKPQLVRVFLVLLVAMLCLQAVLHALLEASAQAHQI